MAIIDDQLADLLGKNADLYAAYEVWANGQIMLLAGTVDDPDSFNAEGGKTGALGYYPVVNISGQTIYVPCQARLRATALGAANPEVVEEVVAASGAAVSAALTATDAAGVAQAMANFRATRAEGVAAFPVGAYFTSAETGAIRTYKRVAAAPGYVDQGDAAAPASRVDLDGKVAIADIREQVVAARAGIAAMRVPVDAGVLRVMGFAAPGDCPPYRMRRVPAKPGHPGCAQDADGQWWEVCDDVLDVRAFGAKGDCPDVSAIPGVQQAVIRAQVQAATNDIAAFRDALWAARDTGASTVQVGGARIYRIAYSNGGVPGLAVPDYKTLQGLPGARLEIDFSLASENSALAGVAGTVPIHNTIGCGNPETLRAKWSTGAIDGYINAGGAGNTGGITGPESFTRSPGLQGVDMRCHTRPNWRGFPAGSGWLGMGVLFRMASRARIRDCRIEGFPNSGLAVFGGGEHVIADNDLIRNGYGAKPNSDQNNLSLLGKPTKNRPDLDPRNTFVTRCRFIDARDEGIAYSTTDGLWLTDLTFMGSQDRALEGFFGTSQTEATFGAPLPSKTYVSNIRHDGKYVLGKVAQPVAAGSATVVLDDAWYCTAQTQQGSGRWIFIPGGETQAAVWAGSIYGNVLTVTRMTSGAVVKGMVLAAVGAVAAGQTVMEQLSGVPGGIGTYRVSINNAFTGQVGNMSGSCAIDWPYQIAAVDYATQTVTLTTPVTNAVPAGVTAYGLSTTSFGDGNGNQAEIYVDGYYAKNVRLTLLALIDIHSENDGVVRLRNIVAEDIICPTVNLGLLNFKRGDVSVDGVITRRIISTANGQPVVGIGEAYRWSIRGVDHDGGLSHLARITKTAGALVSRSTTGHIAACRTRANGRALIRLDGLFERVVVEDCDAALGDYDGQAEAGFVTLGNASSRVSELVVRRNSYTRLPGGVVPDAPITFPTGFGAGYIERLICHDNSFPLGEFAYARQHGVVSSVQARLASDQVAGSPVGVVVRDDGNQVMGKRRMTVSALAPAAGSYRRGDDLTLDLPSAGQPDRARCVQSGTVGTVARQATSSRIATDDTLVVASGSGWQVGTVVVVPGSPTNGGVLTVVGIYDNGFSTSVRLNDVLGVAVPIGTQIAVQQPAFRSGPAL